MLTFLLSAFVFTVSSLVNVVPSASESLALSTAVRTSHCSTEISRAVKAGKTRTRCTGPLEDEFIEQLILAEYFVKVENLDSIGESVYGTKTMVEIIWA